MNEIRLKGFIRDIQHSHTVGDIEYDKANLVVPRENGIEDVLNLRFKKFSNIYKENQEVELLGNVRSYSKQLSEDKNKVEIYVFTYFDKPNTDEFNFNEFEVDGRICKLDKIRVTSNGKSNMHFILANNIDVGESGQKLNSYLPCIAWGKLAKQISKLKVGIKLKLIGKLQSRQYKKYISNEEFEIRVAHEVYVKSFEIIND